MSPRRKTFKCFSRVILILFSQAAGILAGLSAPVVAGQESSSRNAAVFRVRSDYLPGDVLEPWEGGPAYYGAWTNGPSTDTNFFPMAVWLQSPENASTAATYKNSGINTHVGLWEGPTESQLSAIAALNTTTLCDQNATGLHSVHSDVIKAWMHQDEPDNAQGGTQDPVPVAEIVDRYGRMKANDPTRPVYLNFGQGVACDAWYGRGNRTNHPEDYAAYSEAADILSFDVYPMNVFPLPESSAPWFRAFNNAVAQNPWYVAAGVDRLRNWTDSKKPVWVWIECTNINGEPDYALTPAIVKAEVWMAIIHGARGIGYFCHQFSPSFIEAGLLANAAMRDGVSAVNAQIASLAPVLNTQSVSNGVIVASGNPAILVDAMVKRSDGYTYVFAVSMRPGSTTAVFALRDFTGTCTIEVIGENRDLTAVDGVFQDDFPGYGVHLYRASNPRSSGVKGRERPRGFGLHPNFPNPFNGRTRIPFSLSGQTSETRVLLRIFDVLGRERGTLVDEEKSGGYYSVEWDPDSYGVAGGVFICVLETGDAVDLRKLVYIP
ncbi:hypothetical protein JW906_00560 [bacterium]|nr:hypothetical protein [bacterium]